MRATTEGLSSAAWRGGGSDVRGEEMRRSALMTLVWWLGVFALLVVIGTMIAAIIVLAVRIDDIDKERGPRGFPGRDGTTLVVPFLNGLYEERVNQTNITTAAYIANALGFRVQTTLSVGHVGGTNAYQFGTNYFIVQLVRYKNSTFNVLATCSGVATYGFLLANGTEVICAVEGKASYVFNPATGVTVVNNIPYLSSSVTCSSGIIFLGNPGWTVQNGLSSSVGGMTFNLDMFFMNASVTNNVAMVDAQCTYVNILP